MLSARCIVGPGSQLPQVEGSAVSHERRRPGAEAVRDCRWSAAHFSVWYVASFVEFLTPSCALRTDMSCERDCVLIRNTANSTCNDRRCRHTVPLCTSSVPFAQLIARWLLKQTRSSVGASSDWLEKSLRLLPNSIFRRGAGAIWHCRTRSWRPSRRNCRAPTRCSKLQRWTRSPRSLRRLTRVRVRSSLWMALTVEERGADVALSLMPVL